MKVKRYKDGPVRIVETTDGYGSLCCKECGGYTYKLRDGMCYHCMERKVEIYASHR
jgi:hypothetical protein